MEQNLTFDEGVRRRALRAVKARNEYQPRRAVSDYMEFLRRTCGALSCDTVHPQDTNRPEVYCLFTIPSQHVYGDCLEELLDKAMNAAEQNGRPWQTLRPVGAADSAEASRGSKG